MMTRQEVHFALEQIDMYTHMYTHMSGPPHFLKLLKALYQNSLSGAATRIDRGNLRLFDPDLLSALFFYDLVCPVEWSVKLNEWVRIEYTPEDKEGTNVDQE